METRILKEAPAILIDLIVGAIGFAISIGWWKVSGRTVDRDSTIFIAKMWIGIAIFGIFLAFVM